MAGKPRNNKILASDFRKAHALCKEAGKDNCTEEQGGSSSKAVKVSTDIDADLTCEWTLKPSSLVDVDPRKNKIELKIRPGVPRPWHKCGAKSVVGQTTLMIEDDVGDVKDIGFGIIKSESK